MAIFFYFKLVTRFAFDQLIIESLFHVQADKISLTK